MRKNVKNTKVLRAISIVLAAMITVTAIPASVLAEEGEEGSIAANPVNSIITSREEQVADAIENVEKDYVKYYEPESKKVCDSYELVQTSVNALAESEVTQATQIVIGTNTYDLPTENYIDDLTEATDKFKTQVYDAYNKLPDQVAEVQQHYTNIKTELGNMKSADAAIYKIQDTANDAASTLDSEDKVTDYDVLAREISDAGQVVSKAVTDVKASDSVDDINALVNDATEKAKQARIDYERKERAAVAAERAYNEAQQALAEAKQDYFNALDKELKSEKDLTDTYTAMYEEAQAAANQAKELKKKADKAVETAQAAVDLADQALAAANSVQDAAAIKTIEQYKASYDNKLNLAKEVVIDADKGLKDADANKTLLKSVKDTKLNEYENHRKNHKTLVTKTGVEAAEGALKTLKEKYEAVQSALKDISENYLSLTGMLEELKTVSAARIAEITPVKQSDPVQKTDSGSDSDSDSDSHASSSSSADSGSETMILTDAKANIFAGLNLTALTSDSAAAGTGRTRSRGAATDGVLGARADETDDKAQEDSSKTEAAENSEVVADQNTAKESTVQENAAQSVEVTDSALPQADKPFEENAGMNWMWFAGIGVAVAGAGAFAFRKRMSRSFARKDTGNK